MEEYFPEVVAILEKNRKTRIPLKRTGALFLNTRPPKASGPADAPDTGGPGGGGMIGEEEPKETGRREPGDLLGEAKKGGGQKLESRNVMGSGTTGVSPHPVVLQAETGSGGGLGRALGNGFKFIDLIQSTETDEEEEEPKSTEEDGGRTKLMVASESGDAEKVKMLLADQDVCVDGQDIKGRTALSLAAEEGHAAVVRLLVEARANVDLQDKKGWTPFNRACMENRTDVVQLLLDAKANPNIKSNNGWTPLLELSQHGHTDLVRQVIEELNTNVNIQGTAGGTALMVASSKRHGAIVRLLLDANSDTSLQYNGDTALINASSRGHADIVCLLLDAQKGKGETDPKERGKALMKACGNGRAKVVQMPIHQSPEFCFSEVDRDNSTVLMLAVKKGDVEIVELLLSFSAAKIALDTPDAKGFTPLMQAAARGHTRLADLLIGRGADLELEDGHGRTALIVAEEAGNLQVAERLRSAGKGKGKREDSWSVEMKAEWAELRSLIDIGAVAFWPLHFLKSLLRNDNRLPYRQKIAKTAETLGTVCDPFSAQTMAPEPPHPVGAPFKLVAVSYPWLSREHPDPEGFRLRSVVEQLDQYWWAQEGSLVSAYVFWDFLSLYQHPPGSKRTSEQDALFKAGLSKMDVIYSSPHTHVIRSTDVPSANPTPYSDRGWCYFEAAVTTFKPPGQVASDEKEKAHRQNKGVQTEENAIRIPATPEVFDAEIDTKKFTNGKSDADPVKALYRSFLQRSAHKLRVFADGSWASSEKERRQMDASTALRLAEIVEFVSADTSLSTRLQPQVLDLQGSVFDGAVREWKISLSAEEQKEALELGQALERLLSSFGKLGSVRFLNVHCFDFSRGRVDEFHQKLKETYMGGLQRGLRALFPQEGPCACPLEVNLPLLAAAGVTEVIARILNGSAAVDVDVKDPLDRSRMTALLLASRNGHVDVVRLLIAAKADVEARSNFGESALMVASQNGHADIVGVLLQSGADVEVKDQNGDSCLIRASSRGHADVVHLLLEANANVDVQGLHGETALGNACSHCNVEIVRLLLQAKANVDIQNTSWGTTALMTACQKLGTQQGAEIVRLLIDAGANVDIEAKDRWTPVAWASMHNRTDIVQLLTNASAANLKEGEKSTGFGALHLQLKNQIQQLPVADASTAPNGKPE